MRLSDFTEINPYEKLPKGTIAKKISMEQLEPYKKFVSGYSLEAYSGGAKFRNGDTIMARITPCLENGKTAFVSTLDKNEVGFGSTEYIVFRAKDGISHPDFVYYLVISSLVREPAIKSMVGSSGRQRVQQTVIDELEVPNYSLAEQQHIVDILGSIDEKIENNERIMDLLIADLGLKYKSTFKNNSNQQVPLSYFIKDTIGGDWGKEQAGGNFLSKVICIRGTDIPELSTGRNGNPPARFILSKNLETKKLEPWEIIIEISGGSPTQSTGRCALITHEMLKQYATPVICTNFCRAIKCKRNEYATYVFSVLSAMYNDNLFFNYENGTTGIKNLDLISILEKETVYLPSETELLSFYQYTEDIYRQVEHFKFQNSKLKELKQLYLKKFFG